MLNASEKQRYERQLIMPEISESGQTKIRNASIFIAGIHGWNMSFKTTHLTRNEDCNVCRNARSCHVPEN